MRYAIVLIMMAAGCANRRAASRTMSTDSLIRYAKYNIVAAETEYSGHIGMTGLVDEFGFISTENSETRVTSSPFFGVMISRAKTIAKTTRHAYVLLRPVSPKLDGVVVCFLKDKSDAAELSKGQVATLLGYLVSIDNEDVGPTVTMQDCRLP